MLALFTDAPDPLAAMRRAGIDARVAWNGDDDSPALVMVKADPENLQRLHSWDGTGDGGSVGLVAGLEAVS